MALLITSLAFAAFHLQWSQFPLLFGMGFIFGWTKLKTGTLRLPLFLHALNNYLALTLAT